MTIRKCRNGWHRYDGRGFEGICSKCILGTRERVSRIYRGTGRLPDVPPTRREMPVRSKRRLELDYRQAAGMLRHDLVWSADFDAIRLDLARVIEQHADAGTFHAALTDVVHRLIADENDLTI